MSTEKTERIAVLIDADNTRPSIIDGLLAEIAKYGVASVRRIYGDWTSSMLKGWKEVLLEHSVQPIQQFGYTRGKNATDSAMIIDAMDLLYTGKFDAFCIVSSDSDFTRLASRIRESGLLVYGFGEKKTPAPFVSACDKFIYTEVLSARTSDNEAITRKSTAELRKDTRLVRLLRNAVDSSSDESGWAHLATVGSNIAKQSPEFDPRNYGYSKLGELVGATRLFDLEERKLGDGHSKSIYLHDKREKRKKTPPKSEE
ncbi:NYN domain-containing protein [Prosthecochloris sp. N3]|uniref:NYN domain-containing protein n=1 Tax=Prosthecochloris ethylica TaxID=2743976 RepID=A0ABR9XNJ1_9CHLB|nr:MULTISPECIES: NYN domain-containing protein [Prosthecochloris]MEC9487365.1 NYN domain-containing protein [Prosthecochloris sp.]MBF0585697.1 NYN domain-containing protein [Prosthecochloris ethylica]MBF0635607.1 NYN domain-containing protein [Prosthecochloris ethylica]NUK46906.1 NYN domain-containing protein [Prosthecochloris ethylica]RNA65893.1 NYN domain-containing protein [Prosthecochloris sp. ZM_2]